VDVDALFARLCAPSAADDGHAPAAGPEEPGRVPPYADACCGDAMRGVIAAQPAAVGGAPRMVHISELPSFTCGAASGHPSTLSCAFVNDDFCDCEADAADEPDTGACPAGVFYCPSGVRVVMGGEALPAGQAAAAAAAAQQAAAGRPRTSRLGPQAGAAAHDSSAAGRHALAARPPSRALPAAAAVAMPPSALAAHGYIPASKVRDGFRDCEGGEDERPTA
jgi:hypothetical protein